MNWKDVLQTLEWQKDWDTAIEFMQQIIKENPHDMQAYMCMNFLLMNLLAKEDYDLSKQDHYEELCSKYFHESYTQYHDNPDFLFFMGMTACMSEWYFNLELENAEAMLQKAAQLAPENPLYQYGYYITLNTNNHSKIKAKQQYAQLVLKENSPIKKLLENKGSLGNYHLKIMTSWAKDILLNQR